MAFDGITVANIAHELNKKLTGGRIDKAYQPESDEIILLVRSNGVNYRLLITANASHPRIHLTEKNKDNPLTAPMFCMVLRKHLTGGRIVCIEQPDFERIINIKINSLNEMGDMTEKTLIVEIMGKHSNIILADENGVILDCIKHVSHALSSVREVLPGKIYAPAPSQNKINPLELEKEQFLRATANIPIYQAYTGISPIIGKEIMHRSQVNNSDIFIEFKKIMDGVTAGNYSNEVIFDDKNKPVEFSCFEMLLYKDSLKKQFGSASEMLEYFYDRRDSTARISQKSQDLRKLVQLNIDRCLKKRDIQQNTLEEIKDRAQLKMYGELLTSNIYMLKKGMDKFTTTNFYDEACPEITIELDVNRTPSENAQLYFKKYNKQKRTFDALQVQIAQNDSELDYLEGVMSAVFSSSDEADINEIRDELAEQGFAKRRKQAKGGQKPKKTFPLLFKSSDGFDIYVGKNNKQNDELTLRFAMSDDIWLHTKDIPGSHVIIRLNGRSVSETAVEEAANLAAFYSKAKNGSNVPVDYTPRKNVKKPSGAKPGFVIYEKNKTVYVTPDEKKFTSI